MPLADAHWSAVEVVALVRFVIARGYTDRWPFACKTNHAWSEAASFEHSNAQGKQLRSVMLHTIYSS